MRKQILTLTLVGGLGLAGAALVSPGFASAADSATTAAAGGIADRVAHIKSSLAGLVSNGTITQAQADKVATTLAADMPPGRPDRHGMRGPGHLSPEAIAKVLGITTDQLRTAHAAGKTLAQIAADRGIRKADLISTLVAAAKAQLAADVTAGRITQAEANDISADLTAHVTRDVDRVRPPRDERGPRPDDVSPAAPSA